MSEIKHLDDVLQEIIFGNAIFKVWEGTQEDIIKKIMQAFKDDGYMKGGEFYKRFEDTLKNDDGENWSWRDTYDQDLYLQAAQRAAGMK